MSMFSQGSFRAFKDQHKGSPTSTDVSTPEQGHHSSPFHPEEDDFDLDNPHFQPRSRGSSARGDLDNLPEGAGHWSQLSKVQEPAHQSPGGRPAHALPRTSADPSPRRGSLERGAHQKGHSRELTDEMFSPSSPSGLSARHSRISPSPSRHHGLTALSPLQAFSPLQSTHAIPKERTSPRSETGSLGGHRRENSLTRSLSRRQSLIANAEKWGAGDYVDENDGGAMGLFSRLTLVKAPEETSTLKRAKSVSALAPFSSNPLDINAPATTARGPRRSFAASSFAGFTPMSNPASAKSQPQAFSSHGPDAVNRVMTPRSHDDRGTGIHAKSLSPEDVVELARGLSSPIVVPEGGFKGAELKRRKSAGATTTRSSTVSPQKPPLALEPVEYVQLDDDTLLPFVDRPAEVADLISHTSNEKLFKLLKAAFPKSEPREHWMALSPEQWNWDEFMRHLTRLTRVECPDYAWIFRARQAVRARSVALWEKLGVCLGCDGDLLNAGGDDGSPPSWGGLGLDQEGEYDPSQNQVWIEGLEAVDPNEKKKFEEQFREEFGEVVEDEGMQASAGMTALLGTIGEGEEELARPRQTTAQRAARQATHPQDPLDPSNMAKSPSKSRSARSRSFVGLQILTSPTPSHAVMPRSPSMTNPGMTPTSLPVFDRGPGSPLFPSSFSSLSVEPNLGRGNSVALGGAKPSALERSPGGGRWGIPRKQSGAGLSESAITFASESDYSHSEIHA